MSPARNETRNEARADATRADQRRDVRYQVRFPAQLACGRHKLTLLTEDVSRRGVFLRTDTPPPLRQLVRLQLVLPPGRHALRGHGMIVHVVPPTSAAGRTPGVGVQLYAWDRETQLVWEQFVAQVQRCCPESLDQAPLDGTIPPPALTPTPHTPMSGIRVHGAASASAGRKADPRRVTARQATVLLVETRTAAELHALYTRDVTRGVVSVETTEDVPVGTEVLVNVRHPETDRNHLLDGVIESRQRGGLIVRLVGLDREARHDFLDFVRAGVHVDDEPLIRR